MADKPITKTDVNSRSILSIVITLFGLVYLLLILLGQVDGQSKRFQMPEVIVFTVVLLLNSETLQRISKLQFGKEGVSLELNEIKRSQDEIKQNQVIIQETQQEQRESITELKKIFDNFIDNNKPLVDLLKRASDVSITDKFLLKKSSLSSPPDDASHNTLTAVLQSIVEERLDSMVPEWRKDRQSVEDKIPFDQE